jgi:hypothetical protein
LIDAQKHLDKLKEKFLIEEFCKFLCWKRWQNWHNFHNQFKFVI